MDEHWEHREHVIKKELPLRPSANTSSASASFLSKPMKNQAKYTLDWLGDDNVVFSTDYPHSDTRFPEAVDTFVKIPFAEDSIRKILWDNTARLYDIS